MTKREQKLREALSEAILLGERWMAPGEARLSHWRGLLEEQPRGGRRNLYHVHGRFYEDGEEVAEGEPTEVHGLDDVMRHVRAELDELHPDGRGPDLDALQARKASLRVSLSRGNGSATFRCHYEAPGGRKGLSEHKVERL